MLIGFLLQIEPRVLAQATSADQTEVAVRMIGHQVLLASGDETSRVLPVTREFEKYRIVFEKDISIVPDSLANIVDRVMQQTNIATSYMIQVEECETKDIVYAFQVGGTDQSTLIPCRGRDLPTGCYQILFASIDQHVERPQEASPSGWHWSKVFYAFIALICASTVILLLYLWMKSRRPKPTTSFLILGNYRFDKLNSKLIFAEQHIELTSKEADLLSLLYETANTTVERDVILNKVWGDEGDYIGRTLDVFISKLRKKLELDPKVRIVNVRGVGYKLVLDVS